MTETQRLDLSRPRDLSAIVGDALGLLRAHFGTFLAIAAAVVVPVNLIVSGVGLEQLWAGYDDSPTIAQAVAPASVSYLVTSPLIVAMTVRAVLEAAAGRAPRAGQSIQEGLDVFAPVFAAILLAGLGVALGTLALIIPGIYLGIRWFFVAQAVVIDRRRGADALRRSGELVEGSWWRVFGIALAINLLAALAAALLTVPLELGAESADSAAISLAGQILGEILIGPFLAIASTLLFFDLVARRGVAAMPPVVPPPAAPGPPDPPGLPPRR